MQNKHPISKKLILTAKYFEKELPAPIVEIYLSALERFSDQEISAALSSAMKTLRFFPKIAELVELLEGDSSTKALAAWDTVMTQARKTGRRTTASLGPVIDSAVRILGGWEKIADHPIAQLQFLQRDFVEAYEAASHSAFYPDRMLEGATRKALQ